MSSLYIVIPAYNESENIEKTIDQWYPVVERHNDEGNSRLVIINDGSKDNTYELLQKCAATRPLLVSLDKPNGGHGPTVTFFCSRMGTSRRKCHPAESRLYFPD